MTKINQKSHYYSEVYSLKKMAMDWMLDQTVDKEVKLMSKKFKGGNKKEGKGK